MMMELEAQILVGSQGLKGLGEAVLATLATNNLLFSLRFVGFGFSHTGQEEGW